VGVWVPLGGPVHTHDGNVEHDDELFAGDELYVSMTLVSTYDGRVLWHAREHLDLDAEDNADVDRMVQSFPRRCQPAAGRSRSRLSPRSSYELARKARATSSRAKRARWR
jgi:hypothetical protein